MKKISSKQNNRMKLRNKRRMVLASRRKAKRKYLRLYAEKLQKQLKNQKFCQKKILNTQNKYLLIFPKENGAQYFLLQEKLKIKILKI